MRVHREEKEAGRQRECSILTSCRVADDEVAGVHAEGEEAVAAGLEAEAGIQPGGGARNPRDGPELVGGGDPWPVVEGDEVQGLDAVAHEVAAGE